MRTMDPSEAAAAVLLAGIAAVHALLGGTGPWPRGAALQASVPQPLPAPGSSARKAFEWCTDNVSIIHDVYWASACMVAADEQRRRRTACLEARGASGGRGGDPPCDAVPTPPDDSPDCTLPEHLALVLNKARAKAEQQCLEEAVAGPR